MGAFGLASLWFELFLPFASTSIAAQRQRHHRGPIPHTASAGSMLSLLLAPASIKAQQSPLVPTSSSAPSGSGVGNIDIMEREEEHEISGRRMKSWTHVSKSFIERQRVLVFANAIMIIVSLALYSTYLRAHVPPIWAVVFVLFFFVVGLLVRTQPSTCSCTYPFAFVLKTLPYLSTLPIYACDAPQAPTSLFV